MTNMTEVGLLQAVSDGTMAAVVRRRGSVTQAEIDKRVEAFATEETLKADPAVVGDAVSTAVAAELASRDLSLPARMILARDPEALFSGPITRSASGAPIAAAVRWPNGVRGAYVGVESTILPGAIDSYAITYLGALAYQYEQPKVIRNASGVMTARPAIVESVVSATLSHRWRAADIVAADGARVTDWTPGVGATHFVQPTAANAPYFTANAHKGRPGVRSTVAGERMTASFASAFAQPVTIAWVYKITAAGGVAPIFHGSSGIDQNSGAAPGALFAIRGTTGNVGITASGSAPTSTVTVTDDLDSDLHVLVAVYAGAASRLYLDGRPVANGVTSPNAALAILGFGRLPTANQTAAASVFEAQVHASALSPDLCIALAANLLSYYDSEA